MSSTTYDINKHMGPGGIFFTGASLQQFQSEALVRLGWDEGVEAFLGYLYHIRSEHSAGSPTADMVDEMLKDWETWANCRFGEGVQ